MDLNLTTRQPPFMNSTTSITTFFEYSVSLFLTMLLGKIMLSSNPKKKIIKFSGILKEHVTNIFMIIREKLTKKKESVIEILKQRMDEEQKKYIHMETSLKDIGIRTEERLDDVESRIVFFIEKERKDRNQNFTDIDSKIAFLLEEEQRNRNKSLEPILKRIAFLERVPKYLACIRVTYSKDNHIPVEDLVKIMVNLIAPFDDVLKYLQDGWMGWLTHASEQDLFQFCYSVAQMPFRLGEGRAYIHLLPNVRIHGGIAVNGTAAGYDAYYSYHKKLNDFKSYRDTWLLNFPNNMGNLPEKEKSFAVKYFERVERVLNNLYEKKLLQ